MGLSSRRGRIAGRGARGAGRGTAIGRRRPGRIRRHPVRAVLLVLTIVLAAALPPVAVWLGTAGDRYHGVGEVPAAPVAIVFGAGLDGPSHPSPFLAERIATGVALYRAGKVRALLMSGDHSRAGYDEVGVMAAEARRLGVPASAVVQDHAGFDTYSSCYRARSVWGIRRAVLVTQPFHLPRAVFVCGSLGVRATGVGTVSDRVGATWYGWLREGPAIDKSLVDLVRDRTPTFPGPREHALDGVTGG